MRLTEQESSMIFSALLDQALATEDRASMCRYVGMVREAEQLTSDAQAIRTLATKISKAQEADDNRVPA